MSNDKNCLVIKMNIIVWMSNDKNCTVIKMNIEMHDWVMIEIVF